MKKKDDILDHVSVSSWGSGGTSIRQILDRLKEMKIKPKDFHRVKLRYDYSCCWYENDTPSVVLYLAEEE